MTMPKRLLLLLISTLILAACDRTAPEPAPEKAAEATPAAAEETVLPAGEGIVLVTGATGTQGGAVARALLERGHAVRGLTRNPQSEAAQALAALGAEMVRGDYDDPASLAAAMNGAHGVFAVTLFWQYGYEAEVEQGKRLIDLAEEAGVAHFVLTSVAGADDETGIPHFESKWEVEQYLHQSELDWTIIRPVEFMDNWHWSLEFFRNGQLVDPRGLDSSHQWIAARDIGFFAAEAFEHPAEWVGLTQEIAGDALTLEELMAVLSQAFGREFVHIQPSWEEYEERVGEEIAIMVRWFEEEGYAVDVEALRARYPGLQTAAEFLTELARDGQ